MPPSFCPHSLLLADGQEHTAEVHELGRDFLVSASPLTDDRGSIIGSVHVARDITERKQAEEALQRAHDELEHRVQERTAELKQALEQLHQEMDIRQQAEDELRKQAALLDLERQRFYDVLEMLPAYVVLLTPDYHVPFANRFFVERFGESQGLRCFEYLFGRHEPCKVCETYKVLKTNAPQRWEWTGPDGRTYDIYDYPFTDVDGSPLIMEMGIDITERKQAEEALAKHAALVQDLYNNAPCGYHSLDQDGTFVQINDTELAWLGYTRDEVLGRLKFSDLLTADSLKTFQENFPGFKERGWVRDLDFELVRKDGTVLPVLLSATGIKDDAGNYLMSRSTVFDNSERKRAQEELDGLRRQNDMILNSAGEGIYGMDPEGRISFINPAAARMIGWEVDELIGQRHHEIAHHSRKDGTPYPPDECQIYAAFRDGQVRRIDDEVFWKKDGTSLPVEYTSTPIRDENGKLLGAVAVFKDITGRKQAEEELLRLAAIVESSEDAIIGKTLDGIIISWNPGAEKIYGYSAEEVKGRDVSILAPPNHSGEITGLLEKINQGEHVEHYETQRRKKDGGIINVSLTISPIKDTIGRLVGAATITRDITERKRAEEQLRAVSAYARSLIEASLDPLVTISPAGKVTDVNRATEEATGIERARLIGSDFSDYFTEPDKAREGYQQVLAEGFVRDYPLALRHKSGRIMDVLYNATIYRNEAGEVQGVFAAARDVTELKQAEKALRESEARFRVLFETAGSAIILFSPERQILEFNQEAERVTGYQREEVLGKDVFTLLLPEEAIILAEMEKNRVLKGEITRAFEIPLIARDGTERFFM